MLVADTEASVSDAQSVVLLPRQRDLYSSLLQRTRLRSEQQQSPPWVDLYKSKKIKFFFKLTACASLQKTTFGSVQ